MYKTVRESFMHSRTRPDRVFEWIDTLEMKGYDGLETRLEFMTANRGNSGVRGNERYINADYDAYKKGLKK